MRLLLLVVLASALGACSRESARPAVAPGGIIPSASVGVRIDGDANRLRTAVDEKLEQGGLPSPGPVAALVVPHAAMAFSGAAAGAAVASVRDRRYERLVLLAPTHPGSGSGAVIPAARAFSTPLGEVPVDTGALALLAETPGFRRDDGPFLGEHSIDAVLPLLQRAIGAVPLVPVLVGATDAKDAQALAAALRPLIDARTLVVVSTNLTHYGPRFGNTIFADSLGAPLRARIAQSDQILIQPLLANDLSTFDGRLRATHANVCGQDALRVLLALLPKDSRGQVRLYDNSFSHDDLEKANQVSYAGIVFPGAWPDVAPLPDHDRQALLGYARAALEAKVRNAAPPVPPRGSARLLERRGLFVTLNKGGAVRASVGRMSSDATLVETVGEVAAAAATQDPRFPPLSPEELGQLSLEIDVLGPLHPVRDPEEIALGTEGLYLDSPSGSGLLLPGVATQEHLGLEAFLDALAERAKLPRDQWPDGALHSFTAQVIAEKPGTVSTAINNGAADAKR